MSKEGHQLLLEKNLHFAFKLSIRGFSFPFFSLSFSHPVFSIFKNHFSCSFNSNRPIGVEAQGEYSRKVNVGLAISFGPCSRNVKKFLSPHEIEIRDHSGKLFGLFLHSTLLSFFFFSITMTFCFD